MDSFYWPSADRFVRFPERTRGLSEVGAGLHLSLTTRRDTIRVTSRLRGPPGPRTPVMDRISSLRRRIVAPIEEWLNAGGFEKVVIGLGFLFLIAVVMTAVILFTNDLLGLGVFGSGTGCTNPDPYHPCRPVATP